MIIGVEYVRNLCTEYKIAVSTLEKECGFSNGYLNPRKMKKLPYDRALTIDKFFKKRGVLSDPNIMAGIEASLSDNTDYLMTGKRSEENNNNPYKDVSPEHLKLAKDILDMGIKPDDLRALIETALRMNPDD